MKTLTKFGGNRKRFLAILLIIVAVVYDINPADFIPDIAPFIGWADDIAITLFSLIFAYINRRKDN